MTIFKCPNCSYSTIYKTNLKKHFLIKKPCVPNCNVKDQESLVQELYALEDTKKFICNCGKKYFYSSGLSKHKKQCCNYQQELLRLELDKVKKDLEELKNRDKFITTNNHSINNSINNSNNTINNNTIVVNNFGHEEISHLSPQFLEKCLFYMSMGVKSLTHAIHLDKNKPENHTIKVTNIKSPFVSVMKDGKWIYKNKDEALSELISKENDILKSHYEENEVDMKRKWTDNKLEGVKRWLDRLDDEDKELWTRLKEQIFLLLVNNRDIIIKNM
jgi:hypothetical protein